MCPFFMATALPPALATFLRLAEEQQARPRLTGDWIVFIALLLSNRLLSLGEAFFGIPPMIVPCQL